MPTAHINYPIKYGFNDHENGWTDDVNANFQNLGLSNPSFNAKWFNVHVPPVSADDEDICVISSTPTGTGPANAVGVFRNNEWVFFSPKNGWRVRYNSSGYIFSVNAWIDEHYAVAGEIAAFQASLADLRKFYVSASTYAEEYEYVCTGTDDDAVINQALEDAAAAGGGVVVLSDGIFSTSSNLISTGDNVHITGQGATRTIIRAAADWIGTQTPGGYTIGAIVAFTAGAGSDLSGWSCTNLTVDKLTNDIEANGIVAIGDSIASLYVCTDGFVSGCRVLGNGGPQYEIWNYRGRNNRYLFNYVDGGASGYEDGSDQQGIEIFGGDRVLVFGNQIRNVKNVGILVQCVTSTPNSHCKNITVAGNDIEGAAIALGWGTDYGATNGPMDIENINIFGNNARNIYETALLGYHGTGNASTPPKSIGVNVHDNNIAMAATGGSATMRGLYLLGDTAHNRNILRGYKVHHNIITRVKPTVTGSVHPMNSLSLLAGFSVKDNDFITAIADLQATVNSFHVGVNISSCDNFEFNDNVIDGCNDQAINGITITNFEIKNNKCKNWNNYNGGTTGFAGIHLSSGTSSNGVISGNRGTPCTAGITSIGAFVSTNSATAINEVDFTDNNVTTSAFTNGVYALANTANCNTGTFTVSASSTHTLTNSRIRNESLVLLQNESGTAQAVSVNPANGSAAITFSASNSDTFRYRVLN